MHSRMCVFMSVRACSCVRACVHARVRACVRASACLFWPPMCVRVTVYVLRACSNLTALFGAPHFPTQHRKGAGFSSWRPGSRADFG